MTKKIVSLISTALLFAACAPADVADQYRDALPKKEAVQVGTPSADGSAGALAVRSDALGDTPIYQSEYAVMSYWTAVTLNLGVWWTLELVQFIVAHPPTACDDASCTWGPWVDDAGLNRWQLVVVKQGEEYAYTLSAQNGIDPGPFVPFLTGVARPGADRDHGSGSFTIDFDAQDQLAHGPLWVKKDFGQLAVDHDNTSDVAIGATFIGAKNSDPADPHFLDAAYSFREAGTGGELQIAFANLDTTETIGLRTRWNGTGAGRGDAHYNGPDGQGGRADYFASECWAGEQLGWVEVYDSKFAFGSEGSCAFAPASYADVPLP